LNIKGKRGICAYSQSLSNGLPQEQARLRMAVVAYFIVDTKLLHPPPPPSFTLEQLQREQAQAEQAHARSEHIKEMVLMRPYLCHAKKVCETYAKVRQECAVAGSFKTCLSVKLGSDDYAIATDVCSDDGKVLMPDADIPRFIDCLPSTISGFFK
jgi:hypothetical protein